jgi:hypothetical protein
MNRWTEYLYREHSEPEIRDWARRLKMFRYFRAYGGHANDGDSLDVAYSYTSTEKLLNIFRLIDYSPTVFKEKPLQPSPGVRYTHEEFTDFHSLIPDTEWIKQPGHCEIYGIKVFIWCDNGLLIISANPDSYIVTNEHVNKAEKLERELFPLQLSIIDPPKDTKHYICPKYYPNFFS